MANLYTKTRKKTRQEENAYMLYMMIGSCFHRCNCHSRMLEKNLFLYYKEMNPNNQLTREEEILRSVEKLINWEQSRFAEMNCDVWITRTDDRLELVFCTGFDWILASVEKSGHYTLRLMANREEVRGRR